MIISLTFIYRRDIIDSISVSCGQYRNDKEGKKKKVLASLFACLVLCVGLVACSSQLPEEIVGRYELTSASGTVNGITISVDT